MTKLVRLQNFLIAFLHNQNSVIINFGRFFLEGSKLYTKRVLIKRVEKRKKQKERKERRQKKKTEID